MVALALTCFALGCSRCRDKICTEIEAGPNSRQHDSGIPKTVACASRDRQISPQPERPAGQLRRSIPRRHACRDCGDGRHGEFPGQSSDEQVAADALVSASRRPGAANPLRSLQRDAWFRLRSTVRTHRPARCNCQNRRVIPPVSGHSRRNLAAFYRWNTEYEQSASKARWGRIRSGASRTIRAQPCWQPRSRRLGKHRNGSPLSRRAT